MIVGLLDDAVRVGGEIYRASRMAQIMQDCHLWHSLPRRQSDACLWQVLDPSVVKKEYKSILCK
jgi:hypothetical protein